MLKVSITEFRKNIKHFITLCSDDDIFLTKNGKVVTVMSNPDSFYFRKLADFSGCLKEYDDGLEYNEVIGEEILRRCGY